MSWILTLGIEEGMIVKGLAEVTEMLLPAKSVAVILMRAVVVSPLVGTDQE